MKGANWRTQAIIETAIYVDDLQAAETFYGTILGLRVIDGTDQGRGPDEDGHTPRSRPAEEAQGEAGLSTLCFDYAGRAWLGGNRTSQARRRKARARIAQ